MNNKANKQQFRYYLSDKLERASCSIDKATQDADVLIVRTAIASAETKDTVLIDDDTDLLILLLHHVEMDAHELFIAPEHKQSTKKNKRVWCIKQSRELLGPELCDHLFFVHVISGCDTTSHLLGLGKGMAVMKIENGPVFYNQVKVFGQPDQATEAIIAAGEKALVSMHGVPKTKD